MINAAWLSLALCSASTYTPPRSPISPPSFSLCVKLLALSLLLLIPSLPSSHFVPRPVGLTL